MPKFHIERSISINCEPSDACDCVRDLKTWTTWSPWLLAEPTAKVSYSDDGHTYAWEGEIVGAGELQLKSEEAGNALHFDLRFLKPRKSSSAVSFYFKHVGGVTQVTWTMEGALPIFLFWMKAAMVAAISRDYDRGLLMLKDLLETGAVPSKLEYTGLDTIESFDYVYSDRECKIEEIGEKMATDFEELSSKVQTAGLIVTGQPLAFYPKYNPTKGIVRYEVALPVAHGIKCPPGLKKRSFEKTRSYNIQHTGPYRHLGNAWAAGMMHSRAKVFPSDSKKVCFEVYENDPRNVPDSKVLTTVHFPVK